MFLVATCNIWNCVLYNYYISHGIEPLVIDADDYMTSPEFVRKVSSKIGLDPAQVQFEWDAATVKDDSSRAWNGEDVHPMQFASQNTLYGSSGVDATLAAKNLDMNLVMEKWDEEFEEDLVLVKEMIELAEPHYRYLFEKRFTVE